MKKKEKREKIVWYRWKDIAIYGYDKRNDINIYIFLEGQDESYSEFVRTQILYLKESTDYPIIGFHHREVMRMLNAGSDVTLGDPSLLDLAIKHKKKYAGCTIQDIMYQTYKYHSKHSKE